MTPAIDIESQPMSVVLATEPTMLDESSSELPRPVEPVEEKKQRPLRKRSRPAMQFVLKDKSQPVSDISLPVAVDDDQHAVCDQSQLKSPRRSLARAAATRASIALKELQAVSMLTIHVDEENQMAEPIKEEEPSIDKKRLLRKRCVIGFVVSTFIKLLVIAIFFFVFHRTLF